MKDDFLEKSKKVRKIIIVREKIWKKMTLENEKQNNVNTCWFNTYLMCEKRNIILFISYSWSRLHARDKGMACIF